MIEGPNSARISLRLASLRNRKRISIRELASLAGVDKNTILRIERGQPARMKTLEQICRALGTTLGRQSLPTSEPHANFSVSRAVQRRWEPDPLLRVEYEDIGSFSDSEVRQRLGLSGAYGGFNGFLDCELFGGRIVASVIEIFELSTLRSFPGEELLYCLQGDIRLLVGDEETSLTVGDAATVRAEIPHRVGPANTTEKGKPVVILSVRVEGVGHQPRLRRGPKE